MPFVEIGDTFKDWVYVCPKHINICYNLKEKHKLDDKKFRIFFDEENNLLALEISNSGYRISDYRIHTRKVANLGKKYLGRFEAYWEDNKVIVDFNKRIGDPNVVKS